MLFVRILQLFGGQNFQILTDALSCGRRGYDVIDKASSCGGEGIGKLFDVFQLLLFRSFSSKNDGNGAFAAHDGHFSGRPGVVAVPSEMLGRHDVVSTPICFASDDGDLWHSGFSESIQKLCAMPDDPPVLLSRSWKEARHINKSD